MSRNLQGMLYGKPYWFVLYGLRPTDIYKRQSILRDLVCLVISVRHSLLYVSANKKQYFLGWFEMAGYSEIVMLGGQNLSATYPLFLEGLVYRTGVVGKADKRGSDIMAWKFTRHGHAGGIKKS